MSRHEITFNTNLSEPARTRADFTYKIMPTVISIVDTDLGQHSVTEDIEAVLRKIEYWHQGYAKGEKHYAGRGEVSGGFGSCGSGTGPGGTCLGPGGEAGRPGAAGWSGGRGSGRSGPGGEEGVRFGLKILCISMRC
jgi:hypothetical protein